MPPLEKSHTDEQIAHVLTYAALLYFTLLQYFYRTGHRDQMETMDEVFELFPRLEERRAQLAGTLSGPGPLTVFAPTNDAFANALVLVAANLRMVLSSVPAVEAAAPAARAV